jgi:hypothetical protein
MASPLRQIISARFKTCRRRDVRRSGVSRGALRRSSADGYVSQFGQPSADPKCCRAAGLAFFEAADCGLMVMVLFRGRSNMPPTCEKVLKGIHLLIAGRAHPRNRRRRALAGMIADDEAGVGLVDGPRRRRGLRFQAAPLLRWRRRRPGLRSNFRCPPWRVGVSFSGAPCSMALTRRNSSCSETESPDRFRAIGLSHESNASGADLTFATHPAESS